MTDEEYKGLKERIEALFDYWTARLGLRWWRIHRVFVRDASEFKTDEKDRPDTTANCSADWRYLEAKVSFNMLRCLDLDPDELEYVVVHELQHILVNETRDDELKGFTASEERVCTTLAKAFIWTRDMTREETRAQVGEAP